MSLLLSLCPLISRHFTHTNTLSALTYIGERFLEVQRKTNAISAIKFLPEVVHRLDAEWKRRDDRCQEPQHRYQQRGAA